MLSRQPPAAVVRLTVAVGIGCASPEPALVAVSDLPDHADGMVLLASTAGGRIEVGGIVHGAPQTVDLDGPEDDRFAFRYQIVEDGEVRYARTTSGPVLVTSFLAHWSDVSGVDILGSLPNLGRFPLLVPDLDGADEIRFQLRQGDGSFVDAGRWSPGAAEAVGVADDIVIGTETLHRSGPSENRLDIAILGDGYTEADQAMFREHARQLKRRLLDSEPLASFADYVNIHRVDVVSPEAGASYDCAGGDCGPVDNALGSIFAIQLVNQLTGASYESRAIFQADQWLVARAASAVPWDQVIVLVNSPRFGGMAVHYATATTGAIGWKETAVHELAHVLGQLGDEYVADDCIRSDALGLPANVAASAVALPWDHWVGEDDVGAWPGAYNCDDLYRPAEHCKMRDSGDFCPVCAEQLVRSVLRHADPIDAVTVDGGRVIVATVREGAEVRWRTDAGAGGVARSGEPFEPEVGRGDTLIVEVEDVTPFVRRHAGELVQERRFVVAE